MSLARILLAAAPVGAVCLAPALATPQRALILIGGTIGSELGQPVASGPLVWIAAAGVVGAVLLTVGMIQAASLNWPRESRFLLIVSGAGMLMPVPFVGYATIRAMRAFQNLATAESIQAERFLSEVQLALAPALVGAAALVLGALALAAAGWIARFDAPPPTLKPVGLVVAAGAGLLACLALLRMFLAMRGLDASLNSPAAKPVQLAADIVSMLTSNYLALLAFAGFGGATILLGMSAHPNAVDDNNSAGRQGTPPNSDQSA